MTIHHATLKKAAENNITLEERNDMIVATVLGVEIEHVQAKMALDDAIKYAACLQEYPRFRMRQEAGTWAIDIETDEGPDLNIGEGDTLKEAVDAALDYCQENDLDPGEPEEEVRHVVVPQHYKDEYKARGNPNHCGDWLAQTLDGQFIDVGPEGGEGKFGVWLFNQCLADNHIEMKGKWTTLPNSGQKGWEGRYRMNGRQKLEKQIARVGFLMLKGKKIMVPEDVLETLWERHPDAATDYEDARVEAEKKGKKRA